MNDFKKLDREMRLSGSLMDFDNNEKQQISNSK